MVFCGVSAAASLDFVAKLLQFVDQAISVIALNFDDPIFYGTARAALFFQFSGEFFEAFFAARQATDKGNTTAFAALRFTADPDNAVGRSARRGPRCLRRLLAAATLFDRLLAVGAHSTPFTRVDKPALLVFAHNDQL